MPFGSNCSAEVYVPFGEKCASSMCTYLEMKREKWASLVNTFGTSICAQMKMSLGNFGNLFGDGRS